MSTLLLPAPKKYVHRFQGDNIIDEAVRVYHMLDSLIPDREGLQRNYNSQNRVTDIDYSKLQGLSPSQQFAKVVRSGFGLDDALFFTDDWVGSISTIQEHQAPFPRIPGRNYVVTVKYDTRDKGKITIETSELSPEDIKKLLAT